MALPGLCAQTKPVRNDIADAYLFSHGLGGSLNHKVYYQTKGAFVEGCASYAYDSVEVKRHFSFLPRMDLSKVSLGQNDDIHKLYCALKSIDGEAKKPSGIIGYGVSKGAATWINAASLLHPPSLRALVLEAPFADADGVAHNFTKTVGINKVVNQSTTRRILQRYVFKKYSSDGIQPINYIKDIPNIPILFIHSQDDEIIPVNHSRRLYEALLKQGRKNVYLLEIESGYHADLLSDDNLQSKTKYLSVLHTFYKQYGFPYDKQYVNECRLEDYQPSLHEVRKRMKAPEKNSFKRLVSAGTRYVGIKF